VLSYGPGKKEVMLFIPNMGTLATGLVEMLLIWLSRHPYLAVYLPFPTRLQPVSYARNFCVSEFLKTDCRYLWFVDSDTIPPPNALELLLQPRVDMISGVTYTLKRDVDGLVKRVAMTLRKAEGEVGYREYLGQGIEEIDACGMSCCLIHRRVFEAINPPWFTLGNWDETYRSEDFRFCQLVKKAGFKIYAHFGVVCGHQKTVII